MGLTFSASNFALISSLLSRMLAAVGFAGAAILCDAFCVAAGKTAAAAAWPFWAFWAGPKRLLLAFCSPAKDSSGLFSDIKKLCRLPELSYALRISYSIEYYIWAGYFYHFIIDIMSPFQMMRSSMSPGRWGLLDSERTPTRKALVAGSSRLFSNCCSSSDANKGAQTLASWWQ